MSGSFWWGVMDPLWQDQGQEIVMNASAATVVWEAPEASSSWDSPRLLSPEPGKDDGRPGSEARLLWCGTVQGGRQGEPGAILQRPCLQHSIVCSKTFVPECQGEGEMESAPLQYSLGNGVSEKVNDFFPLTQEVGGQAHHDRFLDTLSLCMV